MPAIPPPPTEPPRVPPTPPPSTPPRSGGVFRRLPTPAVVGVAAALGLGGLYLTGTLLVRGEIAPGTTVSGVDIGGLSADEARERLEAELVPALSEPIPVRLGAADDAHEVDPSAAGLSLDTAATVAQADRPGLFGRLFGGDGGEVEPLVHLAEGEARDELGALAEESDTTVREGEITFVDGVPEVTEPRSGSALDVDGALDVLAEAFVTERGEPARLPVSQARPRTDAEEVERALAEFAEPAMSAPVVLTADDVELSLPPEVIGDHLALTAGGDGALEPEWDAAGLEADERVATLVEEAEITPTDATLGLRGGEVVATDDGEPGRRVVTDGLGDLVWPLLTESGAARTATVATEEVEPTLSGDNFRELGITEEMSSFTVEFEPEPYRVTNIGRAAELINGSLVLPDEEWSFNGTVGERTEENGFVEGVIILDDQYETAQGGGVSAVATTVFNAMFFAGVEPVEYGAHSFYIERYPAGREATVAWGSLDLRFRNDSGNALYVLANATDSAVTITFLGTSRYDEVRADAGPRTNTTEPGTRRNDSEDCVPQPPLEGFDIDVDRVFLNGGEEVGRETFSTHYVPRDEVICEAAEDDGEQ